MGVFFILVNKGGEGGGECCDFVGFIVPMHPNWNFDCLCVDKDVLLCAWLISWIAVLMSFMDDVLVRDLDGIREVIIVVWVSWLLKPKIAEGVDGERDFGTYTLSIVVWKRCTREEREIAKD